MSREKLVLIDGHALVFRAYYAFPHLTSPTGELVNAVYGFASILLSVIEELEPTHIAVTFDSSGPTFRKEEFAQYKANRAETPDELKQQQPRVREVVEALNVPVFELQGFEADDIIGTLAKQASARDAVVAKGTVASRKPLVETVIVTGDKDMFQLVDDGGLVRVFIPGRSRTPSMTYDERMVKEKMGITHKQITDFKGLAGDASDNIPGIKGIGPKTAVILLAKFGDLEGVYDALKKGLPDGLVGKAMVGKLENGKEIAFKSRELATIVTDVPFELDLPACKVHGYDKTNTVKLFGELGFNSLINRLPADEFEVDVQDALF